MNPHEDANKQDSPIDGQLRDALRHHASEAEPLHATPPTIDTAPILAAMHRRARLHAALGTALQVSLGIGLVVTALAYLKADNLHSEVMLSTLFLLLLSLSLATGLWKWMRVHHLATLREIKRVELAVVRVTRTDPTA